MKKIFLALLLVGFSLVQASAQCDNVTVTATATSISTCQSNGEITVSVTGSDVANLDIAQAEYSIDPVTPGGYSRPWARAVGGVLSGVPAGSYTVKVRAFCSVSGDWVVKSSSTSITITSTYTIPNVYVPLANIRKTLRCIPTGKVPIVISGGKAPYTITMTQKPAEYALATTFNASSAGTLNIDNLPKGDYTFVVLDNCTYSSTLNVTVAAVASDFPSGFNSGFYGHAYPSASGVCNEIQLFKTMPSDHELYDYYITNGSTYYEVAFLTDNAGAKVWQSVPNGHQYMTYTLPYTVKNTRGGAHYVTPYLRIKGESCEATSATYNVTVKSLVPIINYPVQGCTTMTMTLRQYEDYDGVICYPYQWRVVNPATNTAIPGYDWSADVNSATELQTASNIPYGTRLEIRDDEGYLWSTPLRSASTPNFHYVSQNCAPYLGLGYVYFYYTSGATFPAGTRVEYISGPVAPPSTDFTTAVSASYICPYSTTPTIGMNLDIPGGVYTFRITLPGCNPATLSTTHFKYGVSPSLAYTSQETCAGLNVFPTGQITQTGTSTNNTNTYFSIESAPSGVTIDKTSVTAGGSLLLPASGTYVIKITYYPCSNTNSQCAAQTITINYEKKPLSLDASVTSAYVCQGGGAGNIRVKGANGSGSYTYELRNKATGALIQTNSTGQFSYGTVGVTYTVKVIDNDCATSFEQDVTMLDLTGAQIVYTGSPGDRFCEGGTIALNCITLGQTSYLWTGPGITPATANMQNPRIPNATVGMAGIYKVRVRPENCGADMEQEIEVFIDELPAAVVVSNATPTFCQGGTSSSLVTATGAVATSGNTLRWYAADGTTVITPPAAISTTTVGTTTYNVSQISTAGCESTLVPVTVTISAGGTVANNTITAPTPSTICYNITPGTITGSTPTGGLGTFTYAWEQSTDGGATWVAALGTSTQQSYSPGQLTQATRYRRIATSGTCYTSTSGVVTITVNPQVVPSITGESAPCAGSRQTYATQTGMTGYTWTVTGNGTVYSGTGTATLVVDWGTSGSGSVSVNYTSGGCTAPSATVLPITISPVPAPTITGIFNVWQNSTWTYTTTAGMGNYVWTVTGGTIQGAINTNSVSVLWGTGTVGSIKVSYNTVASCFAETAALPVTINAAQLTLGIVPASINEGQSATATLCLPLGTEAPAGGLSVSLTRNASSTATNADYSLSGGGISAANLPASITIPAAARCATFSIAALTDDVVEGNETLDITATATGLGSTQASLAIVDQTDGAIIIEKYKPTTPVATTPASEPNTNGSFLIRFANTSISCAKAVQVNFTISGTSTAESGVDYEPIAATSVTIQAGDNGVELPIVVKNNNIVQGQRSIIITITSTVMLP